MLTVLQHHRQKLELNFFLLYSKYSIKNMILIFKYLTEFTIISICTILVKNVWNLCLILFKQHMTRKFRFRNSSKLYYYILQTKKKQYIACIFIAARCKALWDCHGVTMWLEKNEQPFYGSLWSRITRWAGALTKVLTYWNNHWIFMSRMSFLPLNP